MLNKNKKGSDKNKKESYCTSSLTLTLKGIGIKPEIKLYPENKLLDMGSVLINDTKEMEFIIENLTKFTLYFEV